MGFTFTFLPSNLCCMTDGLLFVYSLWWQPAFSLFILPFIGHATPTLLELHLETYLVKFKMVKNWGGKYRNKISLLPLR